jgi:hypothetical protein
MSAIKTRGLVKKEILSHIIPAVTTLTPHRELRLSTKIGPVTYPHSRQGSRALSEVLSGAVLVSVAAEF